MTRRTLFLATALTLAFSARSFAADEPVVRIEQLYATLSGVMKDAKALGFAGRLAKIGPAVEQSFDIPVMTRFAVGPDWATLSGADRAGLTAAFRRLVLANYAHNFDGYSGETFYVDPKYQLRGPDAVVKSEIRSPNGDPVKLAYRMRRAGDAWKVIDVYYQGSISELTTRRAEFAAIFKKKGAKGLQAHINETADSLSK